MDNMMPNMNGVVATRTLRNAGYKYLIIGVTGNVQTNEINEFLDAGADLIIKKPLNNAQLQKLLKFINTQVDGTLSKYPNYKLVEDSLLSATGENVVHSTYKWKLTESSSNSSSNYHDNMSIDV